MNLYSQIEKIVQSFLTNPSNESLTENWNQISYEKNSPWKSINPNSFFDAIHPATIQDTFKETTPTLFDNFNRIKREEKAPNLLIQILPMDEGEKENKFEKLQITYSFIDTLFGLAIVGVTQKGVCYVAFENDEDTALENLKSRYSNAIFDKDKNEMIQSIEVFFNDIYHFNRTITLHIPGTHFQLQVWKELLNIPFGSLSNYHQLAKNIGQPTASRALGTVVGQNPIAYIIPCHRVIKSTGEIGKFKWGSLRKTIIIGWERVSGIKS